MAGTNNFLPFGTGSSPNVIDDATYNSLTARGTGFQSGVAQSQQLNKVWRQSSVIAAAVGQLIANTGANATDSDTIANLVAYIRTALAGSQATSSALSAATTLTAAQAGTLFQLQSGAGAYAVTMPAANAVVPGMCYSFFSINNTYTHTVQRAGTDVIYVNGSTVNSLSIAPGDTLTLASNGSNAWIPVGGSALSQYSTGFVNAVNANAPTKTGGGASGSWGINVTGSSASCTGNAATATTAASCSGNSATATTASSCSGNSATATALSTASGSAPSYAARAWVNFNGTNGSMRANGNMSSVTRNGTGDYTLNFASAMPDVNYSVVGATKLSDSTSTSNNTMIVGPFSYSTSSVRIFTTRPGDSFSDCTIVNASIFR